MKRIRYPAIAAVAGLSLAAFVMMATFTTPQHGQAATDQTQPLATTVEAAVIADAPVAPDVTAPAKPVAEGGDVERRQKCHSKFFPLVKHKLKYTDLVKLQAIVDVDCRRGAGDVSVFTNGRLTEKFTSVADVALTTHSAGLFHKDDLRGGVCTEFEVDSSGGHETHWGQCFFKKGGIVSAGGR